MIPFNDKVVTFVAQSIKKDIKTIYFRHVLTQIWNRHILRVLGRLYSLSFVANPV